MIDFKQIQDNPKAWESGLKRKGVQVDLAKLIGAWDEYAKILQSVEDLRAQKNAAAKAKDVSAGKRVSGLVKKAEAKLADMKEKLESMTGELPNLPMTDVPDGGEEDAQMLGEPMGALPKLKNPKDHIELGTALNILDLERGAKVAGARFYYLKNQAVELEFGLIRFVGKILHDKGFEFLMGPQLLSEKAMMAGGYLGKAKDEVYKTQDDLYLIGTSEQSMLAYHMDEIIEVPKRYASFSTCFRREAGSYGKDVKGIIRTHQFDKVEMFSFVTPEDSAKEHQLLVEIEEEILKHLEIPYCKMLLAAGDLSMASAKTIDLESWIPSQNQYRETHSCSNCTDWQARRANIRYEKGKYVHTLNGTAVAIGRILVALLENHQQTDGSIKMPKALHPYLSFKEIK